MITKEQAMTKRDFEHVSIRDSRGDPVRCRATGQCQTWKTRPDDFRLPVKYGLRDSFYIGPHNAKEWRVAGEWECHRCKGANERDDTACNTCGEPRIEVTLVRAQPGKWRAEIGGVPHPDLPYVPTQRLIRLAVLAKYPFAIIKE